jgi:hypothetical protein
VNCREFKTEMEEADRESLGVLSLAAHAHAKRCLSCRRFREERIALARLLKDLPQESAPVNFESRLRSRLADSRGWSSGFAPRAVYGFAPGAFSIALAAVFASAVAVLFYLNQNQLIEPIAGEKSNFEVAASSSSLLNGEDKIVNGSFASAREEASAEADDNRAETFSDNSSLSENQRRIASATSFMREAHQTRSVAERTRPESENNSRTASTTMSVSSATITSTLPTSTAREDSSTFAVAVHPPAERPRVRVRDERGGVRMMPVDSVTFGGQTLTGRNRRGGSSPQTANMMREIRW